MPNFDSELDRKKFEFYLENPELLISVGEWRAEHFCKNCNVIIPAGHLSLLGTSKQIRKDELTDQIVNKYRCPNCHITAQKVTDGKGYSWEKVRFVSIETYIRVMRWCVTSRVEKGGWFFKKVIEDGFWEYRDDS